MFKEGELEKLIKDNFNGKLNIIDNYFDHANWVVICEKIGWKRKMNLKRNREAWEFDKLITRKKSLLNF